jgi:hypothetical protein
MQKLFFSLILITYLAINVCYAQDESNKGKWWVNVGYGDLIGANVSVNYQVSEHQLATIRKSSYFLADDTSVLYGVIAKNRYSYASLSLGVGEGRCHGIYRQTKTNLVIPFEAQFFLTPSKYAGFGLIFFGYAHQQQNALGAALGLQFGLV